MSAGIKRIEIDVVDGGYYVRSQFERAQTHYFIRATTSDLLDCVKEQIDRLNDEERQMEESKLDKQQKVVEWG